MPISKIEIDRIDPPSGINLPNLLDITLLPSITREDVIIADNDGTLTSDDVGVSSINGEVITDFYSQSITYLPLTSSFLIPLPKISTVTIVRTEENTYFIGEPLNGVAAVVSITPPDRGISEKVFENPYIGGVGNDDFLGPYDPDDPRAGGDNFDNIMIGGAGNDRLQGGGGNDKIIAGDGDDLIIVDDGEDVIFTGDGADLIRVTSGITSVVLEDFNVLEDYIDLRQVGTDFTLADSTQGVIAQFNDGKEIEFITNANLSKSNFIGQIGKVITEIKASSVESPNGGGKTSRSTDFTFTSSDEALDQNEAITSSEILITQKGSQNLPEFVSLTSGGPLVRDEAVPQSLKISLDPATTKADLNFLIGQLPGEYEYDIEFIVSGQERISAGGETLTTAFEASTSIEHSISQRIEGASIEDNFSYEFLNAKDRVDGTYIPVAGFNADLTGASSSSGRGLTIFYADDKGFNVDVGVGRTGATLSGSAAVNLQADLEGVFAVKEDKLSSGELSIENMSRVLVTENNTLEEKSATVISGAGSYADFSPNWASAFSHQQVDLDTRIAFNFLLSFFGEIKLRGNPPQGSNFDIFKFGTSGSFDAGYTITDFGDDGEQDDIDKLNEFLVNFGKYIEDISLSDPIIVAESGKALDNSSEDKIIKKEFPFSVSDPSTSVIESNLVKELRPNVAESISEFLSFKINLHDLVELLGPKGKAFAEINSQGISGSKAGFGFSAEYDLISLTIEPTLYLKQVTTLDTSNVRAVVTLDDGSRSVAFEKNNESFEITGDSLEVKSSLAGSAGFKTEYFIGFDAGLFLGLLIASLEIDVPLLDPRKLELEALKKELASLTNGIQYIKINEVESVVNLDPNMVSASALSYRGANASADRSSQEMDELMSLRDGMAVMDAADDIDTVQTGFSSQSASLDISNPNIVGLTNRFNIRDEIIVEDAEYLLFDDQLINVQKIARAYEASAEQLREIVELYTVFDRAPDALELAFWADKIANGLSLADISDVFLIALQEETGVMANDSPALVEVVYQSLLGRSSDTEGKMFWVNQLDSGQTSTAEFILAFINGIKKGVNDDADFNYFTQKVDIGYEFAVVNGLNNTTMASEVMDVYAEQADADTSQALEIINNAAMDIVNNAQQGLVVDIVGADDRMSEMLFEFA